MCSDSFFSKIWNVTISNNQSCAYAPYIMKMIEEISKKTVVKNVQHTKLQPNKQFTSITPAALRRPRTWIPPPDAPNTFCGIGPDLLKMLRGIFIACKTSKDIII
jgi:hypothetical protein